MFIVFLKKENDGFFNLKKIAFDCVTDLLLTMISG